MSMLKLIFRLLVVLPVLVVLSGCHSVRPPDSEPFAGANDMISLSGNVSLAYSGSAKPVSGNGFFMFRKPDQMRMVILSPFGSVLQEIIVSGELVTIVDAGNGIAFRGDFSELPATGNFSGWRYIHWLIDIDPPDAERRTGIVKRNNRFGDAEEAVFDQGLLITKATASGGKATYGNYTAVHGVAVPLNIIYETGTRELFTISIEDPEVNVPFAGNAFSPDLSRYKLYPLSALK